MRRTHQIGSMRRRVWLFGTVLVACQTLASPAAAQARVTAEEVSQDASAVARPPSLPRVTFGGATPSSSGTGSGFKRFMRDVAGDYKHFFSKETAFWYGAGAAAAGLVHLADEDIRETLEDSPASTAQALEGGDTYGNVTLQVPLAAGWWIVGHATGSARGAEAGRDLLRAQINTASWTVAIKVVTHRTRPNGGARSFPSGHTSAVFATAMVLQEHYGWKIGVPFFAAAAYTGVSRITDNKHWASDVVFGAFVGMASARTVTLHLRDSRFALRPVTVPGGAGLALVRVPDAPR